MNKIKINSRYVGEDEKCFIIAEAGVNHNGDIKKAKKLIEKASEIGADAVKFQQANADKTVIKNTPLVKYQKNQKNLDSQYKMIKKYEFTEGQWLEIADYAKDFNIIFFSKPSYEESVDTLLKMNVPLMKIGSGEITYLTLLKRVARTDLPIIMSTGMSTLGEIEEAINTIYKQKNKKIILLQCTSNYPTDYKNVNLKAMLTLKKAFNLPVGFSDHTLGITAPIAAVALGACVIEKHFTLDKKLSGPDHKASLEPKDFKKMIEKIRITEDCLGSSIKKPLKSEKEIRKLSRKSITANIDIKKGEKIKKEMLAYKRPGIGLSQIYLDKIIGRKAKKDIKKDTVIKWDMI